MDSNHESAPESGAYMRIHRVQEPLVGTYTSRVTFPVGDVSLPTGLPLGVSTHPPSKAPSPLTTRTGDVVRPSSSSACTLLVVAAGVVKLASGPVVALSAASALRTWNW